MTTTTIQIIENKPKLIPMNKLEPLQVARIVGTDNIYTNCIVMRTASNSSFEVLNLTVTGSGRCWGSNCCSLVQPLSAEISVTIKDEL